MSRRLVRIPLTIEATGTGKKTDDAVVAVMVSDLDALEAESDQFKALWDGTRDTAERLRTALEHIARGRTNGRGSYARYVLAQVDARVEAKARQR